MKAMSAGCVDERAYVAMKMLLAESRNAIRAEAQVTPNFVKSIASFIQ